MITKPTSSGLILHEKWIYANIGLIQIPDKRDILMEILLTIHSILRWVIVAVATLAIFKFAVSWAGNRPFKSMDRGLISILSGFMDLQILLGLIYFFVSGFNGVGFPTNRIFHMLLMLAAAALVHIPSRLKSVGDKLRFQYSVFAILMTLVIIFIGVWIL